MNISRYTPNVNWYQKRMKSAIKLPLIGKWNTSDNETGEASLKQHFYIEHERTEPFTGKRYPGNRALCSKGGLSDDGEIFLSIDKIQEEAQKYDCCGRCRMILARLKS